MTLVSEMEAILEEVRRLKKVEAAALELCQEVFYPSQHPCAAIDPQFLERLEMALGPVFQKHTTRTGRLKE